MRLSTLLSLCVLLVCGGAADAAPRAADFVVAPNGSDANPGTLARPFASPAAAQAAVRARIARQGATRRPITVLLRGGTYEMAAPLTFTPADSGTPDAPVVYAAYPGEMPVISGGTRLAGWKRDSAGRWQTTLPAVQRGEWEFAQLWVNGERRYRPRLPKSGYYFIADAVPATEANLQKGHDRFRFKTGDIRADWTNPGDVEVLGIHIWSMSRLKIKEVDTTQNVVTFASPSSNKSYWAAFPKGNRYLVENVKEALSEPGEWYLDKPTGVLTYIPMPGEKIETARIVAPRATTLVEFKGDVDKRDWVRNIAFRGLTFAYSNWSTPPQGQSVPQAESNLSGAIAMQGARDITLDDCAVTHVGQYAVDIGRACRGVRVVGCDLTDLAAGGVKIGEMRREENEEMLTSHNVVDNCLIGPGGRMHPAAVGVWIGHSPYNEVVRNTIHDLYYTGISPGWSWGYGPSAAHHNTIAYNHIYDTGQGVLSDMGGIYTLGVSPGTTIHHNLIHDIQSFSYGGWGIYFDEGTTDVVAENNVVFRTKSAGFHQHYGKNNLVRNNIFAFGGEAQMMRSRVEEHLSFTFERNLVYYRDRPLLGSNWSGNLYKLDNNIYWNAGKQPVTFAGMTLEEWRAKGQDAGSKIVDPQFVDPEKGDFRLRPGSPAASIGFQPIDLSGTGAKRDGKPVGVLPLAPRIFPAPPPPQPITEDFEFGAVGEKSGAQTFEEGAGTARITDETAASGTKSLKLTDAPGLKFSYMPHIYYTAGFDQGTISGSFDLRVEKGTPFYHEWRDGGSAYQTGPSLKIDGNGALTANGRKLMDLPHGQWISFEITCPVGEGVSGEYDLVVKLPGRVPPAAFRGITGGAPLSAVKWWGFVADGNDAGVFYLDNLKLGPKTK